MSHRDLQPRAARRVAWAGSCGAAVLMLACTRGGKHAAPPAETSAAIESGDDWQAGRLPAEVTRGAPVDGGALVIALDVQPPSLNVLLDPDWVAQRIVLHRVYQSLVAIDPHDDPAYRPIPELAERWEISPDGRTYTFHLRSGVKWHDGRPFTAADVIATFDKIFDEHTRAASLRADLAELAHYAAPDPTTLVLTWKRPYFMAFDVLADITIQPAHVIAQLSAAQYNEAASNPLNRHPIGTGPYRFVRWDNGERIELERNPDYWGKRPHLERLLFRPISDPALRLQLAQRGEVDLLYRLKTDQWLGVEKDPDLRAHFNRSRSYPAKYLWIGWNNLNPWFASVPVRRALTMLVDRPGILAHVLYGLARPTTCHFYWASAACDPALEPLPFDPSAAQRLLDREDIRDHDGDGVRDRAGQPFRFTFMLPSGASETARWVTKIKEDLGHAGIEMEIENVEWSAFLRRLRDHDFAAATLIWTGDARMDPTPIWHSSSIAGGSNFISYRNPEVDRLIEQARVTLEPETRNALFRRFGAILQAEQPYTFLCTPPDLDLLHKRIKGARVSLYWWQFEELWLDPSWKG
jgi:peptide/nickel transport system substrate-binding protein